MLVWWKYSDPSTDTNAGVVEVFRSHPDINAGVVVTGGHWRFSDPILDTNAGVVELFRSHPDINAGVVGLLISHS